MPPPTLDRLLLLIGGNPLPNAVAALALANPDTSIRLIYTRDSLNVAARLETWLRVGKRFKNVERPREPVHESDPLSIGSGVRSCLADVSGPIGLNYTGGTKAMAVHAHTAVREVRADAYCSYLDARTFELRFDPSPAGRLPAISVEGMDSIGLDDLTELHGWGRNTTNAEPVILPNTFTEVAKLAARDDTFAHWFTWRAAAAASPTDSVSLPGGVLNAVGDALRSDLGLPAGATSFDFVEGAKRFNVGQNVFKDRLLKGGRWLEHYVTHVMSQITVTPPLRQVTGTFRPVIPGTAGNFDLDVVAMRGYQLIGISCNAEKLSRTAPNNTSPKKEPKLKLLEAYLRARQTGGDEAAVAVVCRFHSPSALKRELPGRLANDPRVEVFGCADLPMLQQKLQAWIERQRRAVP